MALEFLLDLLTGNMALVDVPAAPSAGAGTTDLPLGLLFMSNLA